MFGVFLWLNVQLEIFFTYMETSPLPVKGLKFKFMLGTHGHICTYPIPTNKNSVALTSIHYFFTFSYAQKHFSTALFWWSFSEDLLQMKKTFYRKETQRFLSYVFRLLYSFPISMFNSKMEFYQNLLFKRYLNGLIGIYRLHASYQYQSVRLFLNKMFTFI